MTNKPIRCPTHPKSGVLNQIPESDRWVTSCCSRRYGPDELKTLIQVSSAYDHKDDEKQSGGGKFKPIEGFFQEEKSA